MAQTRKRQVDLTLVDEADETPPAPRMFGRMTITWWDHDGAITHDVTFDPLGRINPNSLDRILPHVFREIQRAQVAAGSAPCCSNNPKRRQ
jgi:hypothetical protein